MLPEYLSDKAAPTRPIGYTSLTVENDETFVILAPSISKTSESVPIVEKRTIWPAVFIS